MVHAVPGLRLRLRLESGEPLEVARHAPDHSGVVSACEFRETVARAYARDEGLGVDHDCELTIEVGVPPDGCVHPSGIIRVGIDRIEVHAFATTLAPAACARLFAGREANRMVHLHHDEGTGVTLVHVEAPPRERDAVLDLMHDLLAGCVAEELIGVRSPR